MTLTEKLSRQFDPDSWQAEKPEGRPAQLEELPPPTGVPEQPAAAADASDPLGPLPVPLKRPGAEAATRGMFLSIGGIAAFAIGLIVTVVSYNNAQEAAASQGGEHSYLVLWGPMLFGAIGFVIGLISLAQSRQASRPGWKPDPARRHMERYWDGTVWTDRVKDYPQPQAVYIAPTQGPRAPPPAAT